MSDFGHPLLMDLVKCISLSKKGSRQSSNYSNDDFLALAPGFNMKLGIDVGEAQLVAKLSLLNNIPYMESLNFKNRWFGFDCKYVFGTMFLKVDLILEIFKFVFSSSFSPQNVKSRLLQKVIYLLHLKRKIIVCLSF